MKITSCPIIVGLSIAALGASSASVAGESATENNIHVSAFDLPQSVYLSSESRAALEQVDRKVDEFEKTCRAGSKDVTQSTSIGCLGGLLRPYFLSRVTAHYPAVSVQTETIAGVSTRIVTPADGVAVANRRRVLINIGHGEMEGIPIAAIGKIKVVSLESRTNVIAVYKALLHDYRPKSIGMYGSPGPSEELLVRIHQEGLPAPGAIGINSWSPFPLTGDTDSEHIVTALTSLWWPTVRRDHNAPLPFSDLAPEMIAHFPDTLLIASTRDLSLSSLAVTQSQLVKRGVKVDLHVWEGLGHGNLLDPDVPEAREANDVIARFFSQHLSP